MTVAELKRNLKAEQALGRELEKYAERWVAVREYEVVADAKTPEALLEQVKEQEVDAIFWVPRESEGSVFL